MDKSTDMIIFIYCTCFQTQAISKADTIIAQNGLLAKNNENLSSKLVQSEKVIDLMNKNAMLGKTNSDLNLELVHILFRNIPFIFELFLLSF